MLKDIKMVNKENKVIKYEEVAISTYLTNSMKRINDYLEIGFYVKEIVKYLNFDNHETVIFILRREEISYE